MCVFCHLHLHTEYSLLDGVSRIGETLEKAKEAGMNACAITDHGVMYGIFEFWSKAKDIGIKPILGCEVYVAPNSRFEKKAQEDGKRYHHLTLLAKNKEGYRNLVNLVSLGFKEGFYYKPRIDKELLEKYSKGIICLTGCPGSPINQSLLKNDFKKAEEWTEFLGNTFDDFYFELMRSNIKELSHLEERQHKLNRKYKLDYVCTVDTHYTDPSDYMIQEIAWCIADGKKIDDPNRRQYGSQEFYFKTTDQMLDLFSDIPAAVENTEKIANMVEEYSILNDRIQPKYKKLKKGENAKDKLKEMAFEKASNRYEKLTKDLKDRIDYELQVIDEKGYNDYFLVVQDYIKWAKDQDILVGPGRGSGAGSVVAYILEITNIDPIRWKLIFERFLNPERNSPPDFDVDFQDDKRDELFKYMTREYGEDCTSFICTFGRLKTKAAIRDVARVMGIDLSIADRLSKLVIVKFGRVHTWDMMMEESIEFKTMVEQDSRLEELGRYVRKLENISRHISIHACGYLVTPDPITNYLPVQLETKGGEKTLTQIEGGPLEYLGFMKFDFLGLANLTIIKNALAQIKNTCGKDINIDEIPLDDKKTFKLFQEGNTTGIFQFESDGMKKYLKDLKPTRLEDLFFMTSAYRPGPMKYIPDYILRKQGRQAVTYLHKDLEPILKDTYGFAIYQEQVMEIAVKFAGYSLGQADMLRRAMGKKKPEIMAKEKEVFIERASKNGHPRHLAEEVFAYLEPFADYGFNLSHAASYSMISYQTAYLKANYPIEFVAGLMQTDLGNADKITRDLIEARAMDIKILPPDVNESAVDFTIVSNTTIRFGLGAIKGASTQIMQNIVTERQENGKFDSLDDIVKRVGVDNVTKKDLEFLVKVGALDSFGFRSQLIETIPIVYEKYQVEKKQTAGGQQGLFSLMSEDQQKENDITPLVDIKQEDNMERLIWEKDLLGVFVSEHPLDKYTHLLSDLTVYNITKCKSKKDEKKVKILCLIGEVKTITTKKGDAMAFLTLEDTSGNLETVVFPRTFITLKEKINLYKDKPVIAIGDMNERDDKLSLILKDLYLANSPRIEEITEVQESIKINIINETDKKNLEYLKKLITENIGESELTIVYGSVVKKKSIKRKVKLTPEFMDLLKKYQI